MNAKTLIAAAALAIVGTTAFADEVRDYPTPSTLTRAEVLADLARARAEQSPIEFAEAYGNVQPAIVAQRNARNPATTLTRVEVLRQLAQARADEGTLVAGEAYGSVKPGLSLRTREEVRAEAIAANRSHRYGYAADQSGQ